MKNKEHSGRQIRGWFPADPKLNAIKVNVAKPRPAIRGPPTVRERLVGGLGAAGGSFTALGVIMSFVPAYPNQVAVLLVVLGVPLLAAAFLVWLSYRRETSR
ncbi:MAG: hypothetical protein NWE93_08150 [Candidatus Bathyarchaeota archaeon]|nr:hypothetical protein [Candidatus Bathyarchaeota archaeon]